jgi:hypothetical protein
MQEIIRIEVKPFDIILHTLIEDENLCLDMNVIYATEPAYVANFLLKKNQKSKIKKKKSKYVLQIWKSLKMIRKSKVLPIF